MTNRFRGKRLGFVRLSVNELDVVYRKLESFSWIHRMVSLYFLSLINEICLAAVLHVQATSRI